MPADLDDSPEDKGKAYSNEDFRAWLKTPRPGDAPSGRPSGSLSRSSSSRRSKVEESGEGDESKFRRKDRDEEPKKKSASRRPYIPPMDKGEKDEDGLSYRDRAKERREGANPDYVATDGEIDKLNAMQDAQMGAFHAVPPPTAASVGVEQAALVASAAKLSIEKSKFLGGDLEHTHLVKGLDFALLQKVKAEIQQREKDLEKNKRLEESREVTFMSSLGKGVYRALFDRTGKSLDNLNKTETAKEVPPSVSGQPTVSKRDKELKEKRMALENRGSTEMFLPGRMAFVYDLGEEFSQEIPTTMIRSKADCPKVEEKVAVRIDETIMLRVTRVMHYVRQSSGSKKQKLKKKEKVVIPKDSIVHLINLPKHLVANIEGADDFDENTPHPPLGPPPSLPPPPPPSTHPSSNGAVKSSGTGTRPEEREPRSPVSRPPQKPVAAGEEDDDEIFSDAGDYDYAAPKEPEQKKSFSKSGSYFSKREQDEEEEEGGDSVPSKGQVLDVMSYVRSSAEGGKALQQQQQQDVEYGASRPPADYEGEAYPEAEEQGEGNPTSETEQESKLKKSERKGKQEATDKRDPSYMDDESYPEAYPGFHEGYVDFIGEEGSDEEADLTKMDLGNKAKRLHRWDFETEGEWEKYNLSQEAMPKAAFQFGVKMADGRKTRKNKEGQMNNELKKIEQIIERRKEAANAASRGETYVPPEQQEKPSRKQKGGGNEDEEDESRGGGGGRRKRRKDLAS